MTIVLAPVTDSVIRRAAIDEEVCARRIRTIGGADIVSDLASRSGDSRLEWSRDCSLLITVPLVCRETLSSPVLRDVCVKRLSAHGLRDGVPCLCAYLSFVERRQPLSSPVLRDVCIKTFPSHVLGDVCSHP